MFAAPFKAVGGGLTAAAGAATSGVTAVGGGLAAGATAVGKGVVETTTAVGTGVVSGATAVGGVVAAPFSGSPSASSTSPRGKTKGTGPEITSAPPERRSVTETVAAPFKAVGGAAYKGAEAVGGAAYKGAAAVARPFGGGLAETKKKAPEAPAPAPATATPAQAAPPVGSGSSPTFQDAREVSTPQLSTSSPAAAGWGSAEVGRKASNVASSASGRLLKPASEGDVSAEAPPSAPSADIPEEASLAVSEEAAAAAAEAAEQASKRAESVRASFEAEREGQAAAEAEAAATGDRDKPRRWPRRLLKALIVEAAVAGGVYLYVKHHEDQKAGGKGKVVKTSFESIEVKTGSDDKWTAAAKEAREKEIQQHGAGLFGLPEEVCLPKAITEPAGFDRICVVAPNAEERAERNPIVRWMPTVDVHKIGTPPTKTMIAHHKVGIDADEGAKPASSTRCASARSSEGSKTLTTTAPPSPGTTEVASRASASASQASDHQAAQKKAAPSSASSPRSSTPALPATATVELDAQLDAMLSRRAVLSRRVLGGLGDAPAWARSRLQGK